MFDRYTIPVTEINLPKKFEITQHCATTTEQLRHLDEMRKDILNHVIHSLVTPDNLINGVRAVRTYDPYTQKDRYFAQLSVNGTIVRAEAERTLHGEQEIPFAYKQIANAVTNELADKIAAIIVGPIREALAEHEWDKKRKEAGK